jgi:hypothetical protein
MAVARTHWVAIDPGRSDLLAAAALDRLIDPQHQRPLGREGGQEQIQQDTTGAPTRPDGAVQDTMVGVQGPQVTQPDRSQRRTDRAPAGAEEGPDEEYLDMAPYWPREQRREGRQECDNVGGEQQPHTTTTSFQLVVGSVSYPSLSAKWGKSRALPHFK